MGRRKFNREFKLDAVRLDRGVAVTQACRDLELAESVMRRWMRELDGGPAQAFSDNGQMKLEQPDIIRLRKEVARLKAERDILEKAAAFFARDAT